MSGEIAFLASNILQTETEKNYYVILDSIGNLWFYVVWKMWSPSNITSLTWFCLHFFSFCKQKQFKNREATLLLPFFLFNIHSHVILLQEKIYNFYHFLQKGRKRVGTMNMISPHMPFEYSSFLNVSLLLSREKKVNLALLVSKLYYSNMFYKRLPLKCSQQ